MKTYSRAPDVEPTITNMAYDHHMELAGVRVGALFVFDEEATHESVLKHQGYPAQAMIKITSLRDRTLGIADAVIVVDRANWLTLSQPQRDALIDHELTHLVRVLDKESGRPKFDALGRPKLRLRQHDHQLGWFAEVAQRHGEASPEVRQAEALIHATGQLYFNFGRAGTVDPQTGEVAGLEDPKVTITVGETTVSGTASEIREALQEMKTTPSNETERQQMATESAEAA